MIEELTFKLRSKWVSEDNKTKLALWLKFIILLIIVLVLVLVLVISIIYFICIILVILIIIIIHIIIIIFTIIIILKIIILVILIFFIYLFIRNGIESHLNLLYLILPNITISYLVYLKLIIISYDDICVLICDVTNNAVDWLTIFITIIQ